MQCVPNSFIRNILTHYPAHILWDFMSNCFVLIWEEGTDQHQLIIDTTRECTKERKEYWTQFYSLYQRKLACSQSSSHDEIPAEVRQLIYQIFTA